MWSHLEKVDEGHYIDRGSFYDDWWWSVMPRLKAELPEELFALVNRKGLGVETDIIRSAKGQWQVELQSEYGTVFEDYTLQEKELLGDYLGFLTEVAETYTDWVRKHLPELERFVEPDELSLN